MEDKLNNPLKVLFLPAWYPEDGTSIAGIFIREHARASAGYNEVVVLNVEKIPIAAGPGFRLESLEEGIRTIRVGYRGLLLPGFIYPGHIIRVYRSLTGLIRQGWIPDIIHAHVYSAGFQAILIKSIFNIPVVLSEHSSVFSNGSLKTTDLIKARLALNRADLVLPVSDYLMAAIKDRRMGRRFQVVPNAVNTDLFRPGPERADRVQKKILFVGLLKPLKGVADLLSAIGILLRKRRDFILDVVGDGAGREKYERIAEKLGLKEVVHFHGLKNKEAVARMMRMSSFLVHPSRAETFGVTSIEALACGKPVIATDLPVFREKISFDRGILFPRGDVAALAGAIDTMLDRYLEYDPVKLADYAHRNYSYEVIGGRLNEIYHHVLRTV